MKIEDKIDMYIRENISKPNQVIDAVLGHTREGLPILDRIKAAFFMGDGQMFNRVMTIKQLKGIGLSDEDVNDVEDAFTDALRSTEKELIKYGKKWGQSWKTVLEPIKSNFGGLGFDSVVMDYIENKGTMRHEFYIENYFRDILTQKLKNK